jgi:hypothetical protein
VLKNVDLLTTQTMKVEVGLNSLVGVLHRMADIAGEIMMDFKEERERRADDAQKQAYIAEGKKIALEEIAAKKKTARARASRRKSPAS